MDRLNHALANRSMYLASVESSLRTLESTKTWPPGYEELLRDYLVHWHTNDQPASDDYKLAAARALATRPEALRDPEISRWILADLLIHQLEPQRSAHFLFLQAVHQQNLRNSIAALIGDDPLLMQWLKANLSQLRSQDVLSESARKMLSDRWAKKLPALAFRERDHFAYRALLQSIENLDLDNVEFNRRIAQRLNDGDDLAILTLSKFLGLFGKEPPQSFGEFRDPEVFQSLARESSDRAWSALRKKVGQDDFFVQRFGSLTPEQRAQALTLLLDSQDREILDRILPHLKARPDTLDWKRVRAKLDQSTTAIEVFQERWPEKSDQLFPKAAKAVQELAGGKVELQFLEFENGELQSFFTRLRSFNGAKTRLHPESLRAREIVVSLFVEKYTEINPNNGSVWESVLKLLEQEKIPLSGPAQGRLVQLLGENKGWYQPWLPELRRSLVRVLRQQNQLRPLDSSVASRFVELTSDRVQGYSGGGWHSNRSVFEQDFYHSNSGFEDWVRLLSELPPETKAEQGFSWLLSTLLDMQRLRKDSPIFATKGFNLERARSLLSALENFKPSDAAFKEEVKRALKNRGIFRAAIEFSPDIFKNYDFIQDSETDKLLEAFRHGRMGEVEDYLVVHSKKGDKIQGLEGFIAAVKQSSERPKRKASVVEFKAAKKETGSPPQGSDALTQDSETLSPKTEVEALADQANQVRRQPLTQKQKNLLEKAFPSSKPPVDPPPATTATTTETASVKAADEKGKGLSVKRRKAQECLTRFKIFANWRKLFSPKNLNRH